MKMRVLRRMEYEGVNIYIMQFGYVFQYLFPWKNEMYQNHIISIPTLWQRILWKLRLIDVPYTKDEETQLMEAVLSGATHSVDALRELEAKQKKGVQEEVEPVVVNAEESKPIPNEV